MKYRIHGIGIDEPDLKCCTEEAAARWAEWMMRKHGCAVEIYVTEERLMEVRPSPLAQGLLDAAAGRVVVMRDEDL